MALFKRKQEQKTAEDESPRATLAATLAAPAFNPYIDELAEHYKTRLCGNQSGEADQPWLAGNAGGD